MMDVMVVLALGLAVGGVVGFVLGVEHPKGCLECAYGAEGQYRRGMEDGWADCSKAIRLELDRLIGKTLDAEAAAGICRRIGGEGTVTK